MMYVEMAEEHKHKSRLKCSQRVTKAYNTKLCVQDIVPQNVGNAISNHTTDGARAPN